MLGNRFENDGEAALVLNDTQKKYIEQFVEKIKQGIYLQENYKCECGEADYEVLGEKDRYGLPCRTVICRKCGLVMTNPRLTEESYQAFYNNEYGQIYRAIETPNQKHFELRKQRGRDLVEFIENRVRLEGKDVLEVGCSSGGILKAFQESGYHVTGIDLSEPYVNFGKTQGLELKCGNSAELISEGKKYDLIILNHVLEHFVDLSRELSVLRQLLRDDTGILYIEVPGIKNLYFTYENDLLRYIQNAHVYAFSKETLEQVMAWNGFDAIYVDQRVQGIFRAGSIDINRKVENYYGDIMSFLENLEKDRFGYETLIYNKVDQTIKAYGEKSVAVYGTGAAARKFMNYIGDRKQIKGFLTRDEKQTGEFCGYPILDMSDLEGIECILIATSVLYAEDIYKRIKFLENQGIAIIKLFE